MTWKVPGRRLISSRLKVVIFFRSKARSLVSSRPGGGLWTCFRDITCSLQRALPSHAQLVHRLYLSCNQNLLISNPFTPTSPHLITFPPQAHRLPGYGNTSPCRPPCKQNWVSQSGSLDTVMKISLRIWIIEENQLVNDVHWRGNLSACVVRGPLPRTYVFDRNCEWHK